MSTEDTVETYIKTVTTESPYTATEVMSATGTLSPGIGSSYISNPHYTPDGRIVFKELDVYEGEDEEMMRNRIMLSHDDGSNSSYVDGTTRGSSASDFVGITFMGYLAVQPIPDDIEEPSENEVELTNAEDGKPIMLQTPEGTDISCNASIKESAQVDQDGEYDYPLGLVEFCFSTDNQNNTVSLTFVTNLTPDQVTARKYNPDNKIYFDIPGAEISQTTYQGQPALELSYDIEDNGQLDLDPSTGSIKDPVGLAVVDSDEELAGTGYDMKHLVAVVSVVTAILGLFTFGAVYKYKMS